MNKTPVTCSRGGNDRTRMLKEAERERKMKELEDAGEDPDSVPPVSRADVWKGSRVKKSGEMSSVLSQEIATKIVSYLFTKIWLSRNN